MASEPAATIWTRALRALSGWRSRRHSFSVREDENTLLAGAHPMGETSRDRFGYDREEIWALALQAWRENPLARRIVALTTQYVVGGGLSITCEDQRTAAFLHDFWHHRLNNIPVKAYAWCDELTRSGNLFLLLTTDAAGMSYIRAVPAANIDRIEHAPNDIEQPTFYHLKPSLEDPDPAPIPAYDPSAPFLSSPPPSASPRKALLQGAGEGVMLHYAINRPVGAQWGESDLAPLLKWLSRYANWLEDRARLNRFRTAFLYVVRSRFASEADRIRRQQFLNTHPPLPGSILVADEGESWEVVSPKLEAHEAGEDGLALKKMIACGAGVPLHFLAEPESSTRTTAEAAGTPTFRHFEQRQNVFLYALKDLCQTALNRRAAVDRRLSPHTPFTVSGGDISSRDNVALALAASHISAAFRELYERRLIDESEFLRLLYKFCGETVDVRQVLAAARQDG